MLAAAARDAARRDHAAHRARRVDDRRGDVAVVGAALGQLQRAHRLAAAQRGERRAIGRLAVPDADRRRAAAAPRRHHHVDRRRPRAEARARSAPAPPGRRPRRRRRAAGARRCAGTSATDRGDRCARAAPARRGAARRWSSRRRSARRSSSATLPASARSRRSLPDAIQPTSTVARQRAQLDRHRQRVEHARRPAAAVASASAPQAIGSAIDEPARAVARRDHQHHQPDRMRIEHPQPQVRDAAQRRDRPASRATPTTDSSTHRARRSSDIDSNVRMEGQPSDLQRAGQARRGLVREVVAGDQAGRPGRGQHERAARLGQHVVADVVVAAAAVDVEAERPPASALRMISVPLSIDARGASAMRKSGCGVA